MSDLPSKEELVEMGARALWETRRAVRQKQGAVILPWERIGPLSQADERNTATTILDAILPLVMRGPVEALRDVVDAEALAGVRDMVAGWNGENRPEGPYAERHPNRLGATLPKTNCGAVYALDEALSRARSVRQWAEKIGSPPGDST